MPKQQRCQCNKNRLCTLITQQLMTCMCQCSYKRSSEYEKGCVPSGKLAVTACAKQCASPKRLTQKAHAGTACKHTHKCIAFYCVGSLAANPTRLLQHHTLQSPSSRLLHAFIMRPTSLGSGWNALLTNGRTSRPTNSKPMLDRGLIRRESEGSGKYCCSYSF